MPWKLIAILQMDFIFDDKLFLLIRALNMTIDWCHHCYIVVFLLIRSDHGAGGVVWVWQVPQCWNRGETKWQWRSSYGKMMIIVILMVLLLLMMMLMLMTMMMMIMVHPTYCWIKWYNVGGIEDHNIVIK